MNNNDIFRRLQKISNLDNTMMIQIFKFSNLEVDENNINNWLKEADEQGYQKIEDYRLTQFLNGLIDFKRGKKGDAPARNETRLNNNIVFTKLKIAFNLKSNDIMEIMSIAKFPLRKLELSAFFRKPGNKHYRECKDPVLEAFLTGLEN